MNKRWYQALHESAHAVAAEACGWVVEAVFLDGKDSPSGFPACAWMNPTPDDVDFTGGEMCANTVYPQGIIAMIGGAAVHRADPKRFANGKAYGKGDWESFKEACNLAQKVNPLPRLQDHGDFILRRVGELLDTRQAQITAVAEALLKRNKLTGDEVRAIMAATG